MDKVRFLMSDTSTQITEACREALEQKGVEVTVVEKDGNKVLQKMLAVHPHVVLLDAFMPGLDALAIIKETSLLPAVCGRVCPQEKQCQKFCTMGKLLKDVDKAVAIGRVERFCADLARETNAEAPVACAPKTGKRVAVIGSGPASITCAADCAKAGHDVTMFEAFHKCGGVLVYGIPEFRLPKSIVQHEIEGLEKIGVKIDTNYVVGRTRKLRGSANRR